MVEELNEEQKKDLLERIRHTLRAMEGDVLPFRKAAIWVVQVWGLAAVSLSPHFPVRPFAATFPGLADYIIAAARKEQKRQAEEEMERLRTPAAYR